MRRYPTVASELAASGDLSCNEFDIVNKSEPLSGT